MHLHPDENGYISLELTHLDTCLLATPFGLLEGVRKSEREGDKMKVWIGQDLTIIYIPVSLLGPIVRGSPGNPHEITMQKLVAEYLAKFPAFDAKASA